MSPLFFQVEASPRPVRKSLRSKNYTEVQKKQTLEERKEVGQQKEGTEQKWPTTEGPVDPGSCRLIMDKTQITDHTKTEKEKGKRRDRKCLESERDLRRSD